jgi:integrase
MGLGAQDTIRTRGAGGLKVAREGVWRVDVELPRKPGEPRRRVSRTVEGTEADAEAALEELRRDVAKGALRPSQPKRRGRAKTGRPHAARRRQSGSGGVSELAHDHWLVGLEGPPDAVTGARRRYTRVVRGPRDEAEEVLARLRLDISEGRVSLATNARDVRGACGVYLSEIRTEKSTVRTDRSACNRLCDTPLVGGGLLGDVVLRDLDWKLIEYVYDVWGRSLTPQTMARYASTLSKVLEYAKRSGWISSNPARDARRPRVPSHRPEVPSREEVKTALESIKKSDPALHAYAMGLASIGCRRGELLALRVMDVHLRGRFVTIRGAVADGGPGAGIYYKPTKKSDWRDVPITEQMAEVLDEMIRGRRATLGEDVELDAGSYVFSDTIDGSTPLRPDTTSQRWLAARGKSDVTFAMLRRFVATELLDVTNGDYRTVASITGNSEETLRRWYDAGPNIAKKKAVVRRSSL